MLNAIVVPIRFIVLIFGGQKQVALENTALRQQLAVFKRNVPRPKLNNGDRLFWIGLCLIWQDRKSALIRAAGNRNVLASPAVQTLLVEVIPTETTWPSTDPFGDPKAHPSYGNGQSNMGSATRTRGTEKTGIQDFRTDGVALDAQEDGKVIADLDDVSSKSRWPNGLCRLLYGSDHTASCAVCLRDPRT